MTGRRNREDGSALAALAFGVLIFAIVSIFVVNATVSVKNARSSATAADFTAARENAMDNGLAAMNSRNSGACDLNPTSRSSAGAPTTPYVLSSTPRARVAADGAREIRDTRWTVRALQLRDRCVLLATVQTVSVNAGGTVVARENPEVTSARLNACPTSSILERYSRATLGLTSDAVWNTITCTEVDAEIYGSYDLVDSDGDGFAETPVYRDRRAPQPTIDASGNIVNDVGDSSFYIWFLR